MHFRASHKMGRRAGPLPDSHVITDTRIYLHSIEGIVMSDACILIRDGPWLSHHCTLCLTCVGTRGRRRPVVMDISIRTVQAVGDLCEEGGPHCSHSSKYGN